MNKAEFPIPKKSGGNADSGSVDTGNAPLEADFTEVGKDDDLPF
jgi:hypothetical protein